MKATIIVSGGKAVCNEETKPVLIKLGFTVKHVTVYEGIRTYTLHLPIGYKKKLNTLKGKGYNIMYK